MKIKSYRQTCTPFAKVNPSWYAHDYFMFFIGFKNICELKLNWSKLCHMSSRNLVRLGERSRLSRTKCPGSIYQFGSDRGFNGWAMAASANKLNKLSNNAWQPFWCLLFHFLNPRQNILDKVSSRSLGITKSKLCFLCWTAWRSCHMVDPERPKNPVLW